MKPCSILIALILITTNSIAQTQGISYQALVVDQKAMEIPGVDMQGTIMPHKPLMIRFSILNTDGSLVYQEEQSTRTDAYGMINLVIGTGEISPASPGEFADIDWDGAGKSLVVEVSMSAVGEGFVRFDEQPLYYVPYAFHRNITATGTLTVDGHSLLKDGLEVEGNTDLRGTLNVDTLIVKGPASLRGTLHVKGAVTLQDSLTVHRSTEIQERLRVHQVTVLQDSLRVHGHADLSGQLSVSQSTTLQESLSVAGHTALRQQLIVHAKTQLGDSLSVAGPATLQRDLYVNNMIRGGDSLSVAGYTQLLGRLQVHQHTHLQDSLNVAGHTHLQATLAVVSPAVLHDSLNVRGHSTLDRNVYIGGNMTVQHQTHLLDSLQVQAPTALQGQVTIATNLTGPDNDYNAYPLRVEGSTQGVSIKIQGTRETNNNFVTFWDRDGIQGRIEGQTSSSLLSNPTYQYTQSMYAVQTAVQAASLGIAAAAIIIDPGNFAIQTAQTAALAAEWIAYNVFAQQNLGVTYESGAGDYAEWLPRLHEEETIEPGDVVGVYGGKISRTTAGAEQLMVISHNPIVLGNMAPTGFREEQCEKVAFLGQVPVRVRGLVKTGDYLVACGDNSGLACAIPPQQMTLDLAPRVVGRAWTDKNLGGIGWVKAVLGIKLNEWEPLLVQQQQKLQALECEMRKLHAEQMYTQQLLRQLLPGYTEAIEKRRLEATQGKQSD